MFNPRKIQEIYDSAPSTITIVAGDPSTTAFGIGVIKADIMTLAIKSVEAFTLDAYKMRGFESPDTWMLETHSERAFRISSISKQFADVLEEYRPNYVAVESSYINLANPSAFGPLMEITQACEAQALAWNPWRPFYRIETTVAKKAVYPTDPAIVAQYKELAARRDAKGKKTSSKEKVQFCVRHDPELIPFVDLTLIDEHAVDAIVVAKAMLLKIRAGELGV